MSFNGESIVPRGLRVGAHDGFYEVSGIEDPATPQRWVSKAVQDYEAMVLASIIAAEEPYDIIIGLARGGLATAQTLAYSNGTKPLLSIQTDGYDLANQPIYPPRITSTPDPDLIQPGQRILLADELMDRGGAVVVGVEWIDKYLDPDVIHTAVTYVKDRDHEVDPTYFVRTVEDVWMDFETQASADRRAQRLAELAPYTDEMAATHGWLSVQLPSPEVIPTLIAQSQAHPVFGVNDRAYL